MAYRNSIIKYLTLIIIIIYGKELGAESGNLKFKVYGGYINNYSAYDIKSPYSGINIIGKKKFNASKKFKPFIKANIDGVKHYKKVEKSDGSLDQVKQIYQFGMLQKSSPFFIRYNFSYCWMLKHRWTDLYQPHPEDYNPAINQEDIKYQNTNRYSYHKITPQIYLKYKASKVHSIYIKNKFIKKFSIKDPAYDPENPMRLTPDNYNAITSKLGYAYKNKESILSSEIYFRYKRMMYQEELARDRVTGLTHTETNPNPNFIENNYKLGLDFTLDFEDNYRFKLMPFYSFEYNDDIFQDYYTYIGHQFGVEIKQYLCNKRLRFKIGYSENLKFYTSDGYGESSNHLPLKDGDKLYKKYRKIFTSLNFKVIKGLFLYGKYNLNFKRSNYPDYKPGIFPAAKNYDINTTYTNHKFELGTIYKI